MSMLSALIVIAALALGTAFTSQPPRSNVAHRHHKHRHHYKEVHFGIVVAVADRKADRDFLLLSNQSIASIMRQTYTNWTLILVGDNLPPDQFEKMKRMTETHRIPNQVITHNIEEWQTSKAIHMRMNITEPRPWFNSGTMPFNVGMDIAESLPHITHIKMFSDDDSMRPHHLQHLREAYILFSDAVVAYTCGVNLGNVYPVAGKHYQNPLHKKFVRDAPMPVRTIGASYSFSAVALKGLRLRLGFQQEILRRKWGLEPVTEETRKRWGFEPGEPYMANDAFSYMEMYYGYNVTNNRSVLCTEVSVDYLNDVEKPIRLAELYNGTRS